jgi:hypothetical protein
MPKGQCSLYLLSENGGVRTRWRLYGRMPTALPPEELRPMFRTLSFWSGSPVELVLPADVGTADWFAWWSDAIAQVPVDHLHVRFALRSRRA